jgi:hypothetical protein
MMTKIEQAMATDRRFEEFKKDWNKLIDPHIKKMLKKKYPELLIFQTVGRLTWDSAGQPAEKPHFKVELLCVVPEEKLDSSWMKEDGS